EALGQDAEDANGPVHVAEAQGRQAASRTLAAQVGGGGGGESFEERTVVQVLVDATDTSTMGHQVGFEGVEGSALGRVAIAHRPGEPLAPARVGGHEVGR